jgi:RTA1 like protein
MAFQSNLMETKWLTNDYLGGVMLSSAKTKDTLDMGKMVVLIGLGVQIVFFSLFILATVVFHYRIHRQPTTKSYKIISPWKTLLMVLYGTSVLIMGRSIFRVAEYAGGKEGELMVKEFYIYIFDAVPMFLVSIAFNIFHPSKIIQSELVTSFPLGESENELGVYEPNNNRY